MAVFSYKATPRRQGCDRNHRRGHSAASARTASRTRAGCSRYLGFSCREKPRRLFIRGTSKHRVTPLIRELSTLLGVGVPLLESLETLAQQHNGPFHTDLLTAGSRGRRAALGAAMGEQPRVFDDLCVNITEVGEDAGTLDISLETLAEFRERSEQLTGRVGTALIYPAIVLTVAARRLVPDDIRRAQDSRTPDGAGTASSPADAHRERRK